MLLPSPSGEVAEVHCLPHGPGDGARRQFSGEGLGSESSPCLAKRLCSCADLLVPDVGLGPEGPVCREAWQRHHSERSAAPHNPRACAAAMDAVVMDAAMQRLWRMLGQLVI